MEILPDEKKATTAGFLAQAVVWFSKQGNRFAKAKGYTSNRILIDNGYANSSREAEGLPVHGSQPILTRAYTPRINGKAERFIRTLLEE